MREFNQTNNSLSPSEMSNIKGGYVYSCEEKKRHMHITCYTDAGKKINTFKVSTNDATLFMEQFNGKKNFKLEDEQ